AYLFPRNLLKGIGTLVLVMSFMSGIGMVATFFQIATWRAIHVVYTVGMALACIFHIALILLCYDYAVHLHSMLWVVWENAPNEYHVFVQNK
ncbi:hypothetical protein BCR42DRAFT_306421, partial [Absidia repens]